MIKFNKYTTSGLIYIAFFVGLATSDVGNIPTDCSEPFPWYVPIGILLMTGLPFVLGYQGGKESDKEDAL